MTKYFRWANIQQLHRHAGSSAGKREDLKQLSQIKTHKETKYRPNIYEGALCSFAPREKYAMQVFSYYLIKWFPGTVAWLNDIKIEWCKSRNCHFNQLRKYDILTPSTFIFKMLKYGISRIEMCLNIKKIELKCRWFVRVCHIWNYPVYPLTTCLNVNSPPLNITLF